jgi:hypothetical protein
LTILVGAYPMSDPTTEPEVAALTEWLEGTGFRVFYAEVDLGRSGRWQRVLAGAYTDPQIAQRDEQRLRAAAPQTTVQLVSAMAATGSATSAWSSPTDAEARPSGTEP